MVDNGSSHQERLWTPWRMRYIGGDTRETGCIFCNRLQASDDVASLILHRAERAFVIMNLFPYNTGHVMVVPNEHAAELDALDHETMVEMAALLPRVVVALRRNLGCDGFNIGLNLGAVAGAGVAEHLHQHVVPRWQGDANFMPILAGTMVIPEMIPSTYAKIRAELARELAGASAISVVPVSANDHRMIWLRDGEVATVAPPPDRPAWREAIAMLGVDGAEIIGWAGATGTAPGTIAPGLTVRVDRAPSGPGWREVPLHEAKSIPAVRLAIANGAPWMQEHPDR